MSDATVRRELLREPWDDLGLQREAATLGIWIFIATEVLFFGGFFLLYAADRFAHGAAFVEAARHTNIWFGTANTAVLLTSSFAMAIASQAAEAGLRRLTLIGLAVTIGLGLAFLVIKGFEYKEDIDEHLLPDAQFALALPAARMFFALYWLMTGVHAIHVTIGMGLMARLLIQGARGRLRLRQNPQVEVTALYWHLVDIIWIFIYPLLYLAGRT